MPASFKGDPPQSSRLAGRAGSNASTDRADSSWKILAPPYRVWPRWIPWGSRPRTRRAARAFLLPPREGFDGSSSSLAHTLYPAGGARPLGRGPAGRGEGPGAGGPRPAGAGHARIPRRLEGQRGDGCRRAARRSDEPALGGDGEGRRAGGDGAVALGRG